MTSIVKEPIDVNENSFRQTIAVLRQPPKYCTSEDCISPSDKAERLISHIKNKKSTPDQSNKLSHKQVMEKDIWDAIRPTVL